MHAGQLLSELEDIRAELDKLEIEREGLRDQVIRMRRDKVQLVMALSALLERLHVDTD
jgi:hypothetical protein